MILRLDRIATDLPPPSDPDPAGAAAVQELMGGRFGEMSTFMNYTFQSFNFRDRQGARPFYDLIANIAGEEFGHIELVAATINTMLTGASPIGDGKAPSDSLVELKGKGNPHHFLAGGQGALPQNSQGRPWNGDYVFSSGDLVEDLTHNFFLETGARNNKLKVYEMVDHPAARALTGYLLVRGGVHQLAYARALENLTGANLMNLFPAPRIPTEKIPECKPHLKRGDHLRLYRFSPEDYHELAAVFNGPHPETGEELEVIDESPKGALPNDLPAQPAVFAPDYAPAEIAEIANRLREAAGLPKEPTGAVANGKGQTRRPTATKSGRRTSTASSTRSKAKRTTRSRAQAKSK
jgi:Mn-containing catalase